MRNFLRRHNHDFGDENTYYVTTYKDNISGDKNRAGVPELKTKEERIQEGIQLRKTNFILGGDPSIYQPMSSTFGDRVRPRDGPQKSCAVNVKDSHLVLGIEPTDYSSVHQLNYQSKPINYVNESKGRTKDLRSEFFLNILFFSLL